jgi:uridine phosphorylase
VRYLKRQGRARLELGWACYHTELYCFEEDNQQFGIIGCAVGAPFAVLIAEQLFASGCELLVSVTSAGQLKQLGAPPYFIIIDRALRDEGTSYHYLPPADFSEANPRLIANLFDALDGLSVVVHRGATWTTDAPFRETAEAIAAMQSKGLLAVEMEAAALYAFAQARNKAVICFAHVTNQMARVEGDFEKGEADGAVDVLAVIVTAARHAGLPA